ncbi:MAG: c-type cytochrome, partial [Myxococcota bacterium]
GGARRTDAALVTVTNPLTFEASYGATVAREDAQLAVVVEDANLLVLAALGVDGSVTLERRVSVPEGPRTVTRWGTAWAVVCQAASELAVVSSDGMTVRTVDLGTARQPFSAAVAENDLFVTLQATGEVARVTDDGTVLTASERFAAVPDARGIARIPDGRLAVSRWRSEDDGAEIALLDPSTGGLARWTLQVDPQEASDTESGGVPSYLDQVLVSPDGRQAAIPSLQAAINEGTFVSPRPLTHQTTVRAVVSFIDVTTGTETFDERKQFDDRGFAGAGAFSNRGDYLFLAMRGSRSIERYDILEGNPSGSIVDVGFAPDGLVLSADDRFLVVHASLSRELRVYDVSDFSRQPTAITTFGLLESEPLDPEVLLGKQLFNDALDTRLAKDSYISCAHCHLDGVDDHRVWDFTDRGEGLRNTISLTGRAGTGHGPIHWSANFDEIQDFEHDIRGPFLGTGLMSDAEFNTGTRNQTLGDPKAGVSGDLDALAAYVTSLNTHLPSPFRTDTGALTAEAARGQTVFENLGCGGCHTGEFFTDSRFDATGEPVLHDVGTLGPGSGQRLGGNLPGLDTPTLRGLWHSAPYLHDGSAPTLRDVLVTRNPAGQHGATGSLTEDQLADLIAYLRSL